MLEVLKSLVETAKPYFLKITPISGLIATSLELFMRMCLQGRHCPRSVAGVARGLQSPLANVVLATLVQSRLVAVPPAGWQRWCYILRRTMHLNLSQFVQPTPSSEGKNPLAFNTFNE